MLDVLAIAAAAVVVLLALVMAWGLDQQGHGGRRWATWLELAFLVSIAATIYGVRKTLQDGAGVWLAVTAVPPPTMLARRELTAAPALTPRPRRRASAPAAPPSRPRRRTAPGARRSRRAGRRAARV